jgi:hypothetical protein
MVDLISHYYAHLIFLKQTAHTSDTLADNVYGVFVVRFVNSTACMVDDTQSIGMKAEKALVNIRTLVSTTAWKKGVRRRQKAAMTFREMNHCKSRIMPLMSARIMQARLLDTTTRSEIY